MRVLKTLRPIHGASLQRPCRKKTFEITPPRFQRLGRWTLCLQNKTPQRVDGFQFGPRRNDPCFPLARGKPVSRLAVICVLCVKPRNQKGTVRINRHERRSFRIDCTSNLGSSSESRCKSVSICSAVNRRVFGRDTTKLPFLSVTVRESPGWSCESAEGLRTSSRFEIVF